MFISPWRHWYETCAILRHTDKGICDIQKLHQELFNCSCSQTTVPLISVPLESAVVIVWLLLPTIKRRRGWLNREERQLQRYCHWMVYSENNMHTYLHSVKCKISRKYLLSRLHEYSCLNFVVPTSYPHKPTYFRTFFKFQNIYHLIFFTEATIRMWCYVYKNYIFLYRRKHFLQFLISPDLSSLWCYLFITGPTELKSLGSVVGIAISYGLDDRGIGVRVPVVTSSGAHPDFYPMDTGALSPWVKRPGSEADYSSPTSAEGKKTWIDTSTPHTPSWG
jgi:hypothetical protein